MSEREVTVADLIKMLQDFPQNLTVWCTSPDEDDYPPVPTLERSTVRHRSDGTTYVYPTKDKVIL